MSMSNVLLEEQEELTKQVLTLNYHNHSLGESTSFAIVVNRPVTAQDDEAIKQIINQMEQTPVSEWEDKIPCGFCDIEGIACPSSIAHFRSVVEKYLVSRGYEILGTDKSDYNLDLNKFHYDV